MHACLLYIANPRRRAHSSYHAHASHVYIFRVMARKRGHFVLVLPGKPLRCILHTHTHTSRANDTVEYIYGVLMARYIARR